MDTPHVTATDSRFSKPTTQAVLAAYFVGHGFNGAKLVRSGIDVWELHVVDAKMPRYKLKND